MGGVRSGIAFFGLAKNGCIAMGLGHDGLLFAACALSGAWALGVRAQIVFSRTPKSGESTAILLPFTSFKVISD